MTVDSYSLKRIFQGWDTYQVSLVSAIQPLARDQLAWRHAPRLRSVGQIASHITYLPSRRHEVQIEDAIAAHHPAL
jgi:hypothetical protein